MDSESQTQNHFNQFHHHQPPPMPPQNHHLQPPPPPPQQQHHQQPPPPQQHYQQPPPQQHHQQPPVQNHQQQLNNNHSTPPPPPGIPAPFIAAQFQQNQQNANPVSGFAFNSSGSGSAGGGGGGGGGQNQNSGGSLSGFGLNSGEVGDAAAVAGGENSGFGFGSAGAGNSGAAPVAVSMGAAAVEGGVATPGSVDAGKKKRGRPRKYSPEGGNTSNAASAGGGNGNGGDSLGGDPNGKRSRGRPLGSGKKQQMDAFGAGGVGFTPHFISVGAGEDVSYKIMSFAQQGPRSVCILSAAGSICNVTLRQAATSGGNVTYEGRYEIVTLTGSFHPLDNGKRAGSLTVSLLSTDGTMVGGCVAGMLVAATPIQVLVGSFISEIKKQKAKQLSAAPSSNILNFSAPAAGVPSSPSQGASSESSEENHDTPLNHGQGPYTSAGQPMQNMSMYSPMSWTNPNKMPPN